jgi:hypothetical protein
VFFIIEVLERRDQVICMTLHKQLQDLLRHSPNFKKKKKKLKDQLANHKHEVALDVHYL